MSSSNYSQIEANNDKRLNSLANKLATFRNINEDINEQAVNDNSIINQISDSFTTLSNTIRDSSTRLTRSMGMGSGVSKMVVLALLIFCIIYNLFKLF